MNFIDVNEIVEMNAVHTAMRASPDKLRSANFSTTEKRILEETIVKFPVIEDKRKTNGRFFTSWNYNLKGFLLNRVLL